MLDYFSVVVGCVSLGCYLVQRREPIDRPKRAFQRRRRKLTADLNLWVGSLKSIASAAPFLGLMGACEGILNALSRGIAMEKHAAEAMITSELAAALLTTAAGLLAAIPATCSYNFLRARLDVLEGGTSSKVLDADSSLAQKFPLRKQISGLPGYGLMAAPCLAIAAMIFMGFSSHKTPSGLSVDVLVERALAREHFFVESLVVVIAGTNGHGPSTLYVNSKKTSWDKLDITVRSDLEVHPQLTTYVEAENNIPWADVVNAIEVLKGICDKVVLLTVTPDAHQHQKLAR